MYLVLVGVLLCGFHLVLIFCKDTIFFLIVHFLFTYRPTDGECDLVANGFLDFAHFVCYARNDDTRVVGKEKKKRGDKVASLFFLPLFFNRLSSRRSKATEGSPCYLTVHRPEG